MRLKNEAKHNSFWAYGIMWYKYLVENDEWILLRLGLIDSWSHCDTTDHSQLLENS